MIYAVPVYLVLTGHNRLRHRFRWSGFLGIVHGPTRRLVRMLLLLDVVWAYRKRVRLPHAGITACTLDELTTAPA